MDRGKLYLIPAPLGDSPLEEVLPAGVAERACRLRCFVVEEIRTARRVLSAYGLRGRIDTLEFHSLNEHTRPEEVEALLPLFDKGDAGYISEAGLPAVADPGAALVALCHREGIEVVPLVGPVLADAGLMASGLNGQSFAFCGYVPAKSDERKSASKALERESKAASQSKIIIETPYRNDALFADMLKVFAPGTRICIAADLTLPTQFIRTASVALWRRNTPSIGKRPCVFVVLA